MQDENMREETEQVENVMGQRIHNKRIEYEMTMEDLAVRLGVGKSAVNKWEKGQVRSIRRDTIAKMAAIFHCDPVWLMGLDVQTTKTKPIITEASVSDIESRLDIIGSYYVALRNTLNQIKDNIPEPVQLTSYEIELVDTFRKLRDKEALLSYARFLQDQEKKA